MKINKDYDGGLFVEELEQSLISYFDNLEQPYLIEVAPDKNVWVLYNCFCVAHIMEWEMSLDMVANLSYTLYRCYIAFNGGAEYHQRV